MCFRTSDLLSEPIKSTSFIILLCVRFCFNTPGRDGTRNAARIIFMRRNPGVAKDGSVKVFIVARVIFERRKPKKACCCAATRTRARPRTRSKPNTSAHACRHHPWPAPNCPTTTPQKRHAAARRPGREPSSRALWTFEALVGAAGPVTVAVDT